MPEELEYGERNLYYIPYFIEKLFSSFYIAALWPCIPLTVPKNAIGTGFGIVMAI